MSSDPATRLLRSRLRLRQLSALVAVADAASLRKAALALQVSQPALSKTVRELEASFGRALFVRDAKGLKETAHGAAVIQYARRMLREADGIAHALDAIDAGAGGRIRIGTIPTVSVAWLDALVGRLLGSDPPVALQVAEGSTDVLVGALRRRELDCVIGRITPAIVGDDLNTRAVFQQKLRILARAGHPALRGHRAPALKHLVGHPWVLTPPSTPLRQVIDRAFVNEGLPPPIARLETYSLPLILSRVANGDALAAVPDDIAQACAKQGRLRMLPFAWALPPVCLMWLKRDDGVPLLRRFVELAAQASTAYG
jgi:DNA-binding transcriptional LysR family regulator